MPPDFASDDDGFAPIAGRTLLFCLEPIGIGTPDCEGLTSYLVRLAREHSLPVRRLVSRLLFAAAPESRPRCDAKFFRQYAATINGVGPYAERFSQALNAATGRADLDVLTLLPWRGLLAANGNRLTSPYRRWCADCLGDQVSAGLNEVYWPLAWSMASVQTCHRHAVNLVDRCPHCAKRQPAIPRLADFGHCDGCRRSLLCHGEDYVPESRARLPPAVALSVAEQLIAINNLVDPLVVHKRWIDVVSARIGEMGCDRATLCRRVGLNPRAMNTLLNRGCGMTLDSFAKVLGGLGMSVSQVFAPPQGRSRSAVSRDSAVAKRPQRRQSHSLDVRLRAAALLDDAAAADTPPKLLDVASKLGTSTGFLRYWHPEKVAALRARHLHIEQTDRNARVERHRQVIADTVHQLLSRGVYPGRKAVESAARAAGVSLIEPRNYAAYRSALRAIRRAS